MDLYQHTRCRSHVDSYKMIHSRNGHSVTVPLVTLLEHTSKLVNSRRNWCIFRP